MLSREEILNCKDTKIVPVECPEWGGTVFVRTMTGQQRDEIETELRKPRPVVRARVAAYTICDELGNTLFNEQDIPELSKKNYAALDRVYLAALNVNEMDNEAIEKLVEALKKTIGENSSSNSPDTTVAVPDKSSVITTVKS